MQGNLENTVGNIILGWLETHQIGNACDAAVAKKLSQRIVTRLDRKGLIVNNGEKIKEPE